MSEELPEANTPARSRRRTAKKVNYAKEQEFSDEDVFEDSEPDDAPVRGRKPRMIGPATGRKYKTGNVRKSLAEENRGVDDLGRVFYTESGYDSTLPPLRERFPFLPEYEEDGTAKIDLIVGRRPVDEKEDLGDDKEDDEVQDEGYDDEGSGKRSIRNASNSSKKLKGSPLKDDAIESSQSGPVEYEYLVKFKGRSYLHLVWMRGADLDSMNKSAKGIYRRYLKKLAQGQDEELENPEFDPAFAVPQKVVDEQEQEITVELSDKELLKWEKQRERELAAAVEEDDAEEKVEMPSTPNKTEENLSVPLEEEKKEQVYDSGEDWEDEVLDYSQIPLQKLRSIINKDGPYYQTFEGSDNPYRDGYIKEAPRKPRASYLFFQASMRGYFVKRNPGASQAELMTLMGNTWQTLTDDERKPFLDLAQEEAKQYEREKMLLEKAQRPTEVWQPLRRCSMVLERLSADSFAEIFLEPVDTNEFPDYKEIIDSPMDLSTVRKKLATKKYQAPEQFARDMRKIWNNCKIYNMHGSQIWHVADYMSKQFERLYHAWVLDFRERYLRWADPRARPWDRSCRHHDGSCRTPDTEMVLCDHCDAMYGLKCLHPPLKKVPSKAWHCPECKPKLKSIKGSRMLSAVAENAARKRAELGDVPKKKIKQTMYLVKWSGLGYEHCTWETRADINDDGLIAEYRRLNSRELDDSFLSMEIVDKLLRDTKHVYVKDKEKNGSSVSSLAAQLYAQTRAFQFSRFASELPIHLGVECGPRSNATIKCPSSMEHSTNGAKNRAVVECLSDLLFRVDRGERLDLGNPHSSLPPALTGEYDAVIPITSKGLLMNVGEIQGSVAFLGYRQFPDGSKGPAELNNLIRNVGDKIIAVDGSSTIGKSFKEVIDMLRESGKNTFAYMRFLENKMSLCDGELASVGAKGRYTIEELRKKFTSDRQRYITQRMQNVDEDPAEKFGLGELKKDDSDGESENGSEGEFQPESDDDELVATQKAKEVAPLTNNSGVGDEGAPPDVQANTSQVESPEKENNVRPQTSPAPNMEVVQHPEEPEVKNSAPTGLLVQHENTRSLAFRLLDTDLGYSSDEGGDEDCAFFFDGVDGTFCRENDFFQTPSVEKRDGKKNSTKDEQQTSIPAKLSDFLALGDRAKLACAAALFPIEPNGEEFENYPVRPEREKDRDGVEDEGALDEPSSVSPSKYVKQSTVKVEQVSITSGETIHVWANIEAAAATLQLRLDQLKQVLSGEYDEDLGDEVGGYKWRYAPAGAKVTAGANSSRGGGGKKAKQAWLEFREKLYDPSEPHRYKNGNRLRDYQVDGVNWLASTWYKKQGCILADEMGLGKTVQIVCYIEHLFRVEKIKRPYLVVVPLSTVEHWRREFEGWTDIICCVYHDRQRIWRDVMREYEWYYNDRPHTAEFLKFDVLVTTYDTLISDFDVMSQIPFRVAVVDEAHRLRNQKGKLLECMREVSARGTMQYGFQSRVLISGTPLQNDLTELWTLLNFVEPFQFPDLNDFQHKYGNMASREQVESLQKMISPYMLRRVKEDVAKDIPAKEETVIDVELTSIQKQYYRAIFEHNHAFLSMGGSRNTTPKLMNIQMELRKVCNHPFLLEGVEHRESERQFKEFLDKGMFEGKSAEDQQYMLNEHGYIMTSGKMVLLDKLLPKLKNEGHKVLIFSQMVKMLDLLTEFCEFRNFKFERLDGRIRGAERQKSIDRFEREADSFIFMLSTRAGGVGINLTAADICIIFDSDWNPQNDVQAQARCHRIGQSKEVKVFRLITSRSFEQEMFERASRKLGLEQAVLGTFEMEQEDGKPSQKEMEQLLKKGAYALLEDDNDEVTQQFCADDIDSILAKRSRTRVVEGTKSASWLNKQGMVVSKSRFSAEAGGDELDMDDPLFWQKVMPDFVTPSIMMKKLNDLIDEIEGRVRGPGRGRGRWKKKGEGEAGKDTFDKRAVSTSLLTKEEDGKPKEDVISDDEDVDDPLADEPPEDLTEETSSKGKLQLTRTNLRKVHKFMSDLKGMLQGILDEDDEEDALSPDEKDVCQKLLLTISVKVLIFTEEQRREARHLLKRMEGDRKRRCRTSDTQTRFQPGQQIDEDSTNVIPEELRIAGRKRKKRRKRENDEEDGPEQPKRRKRTPIVGEDGYLHHTDSEADWSDVAEDIYDPTNKRKDHISIREARRRRTWGADDDAATAAGRSWPVFPRQYVKKVLTTVLDEVMKYDASKGGAFSSPVSKKDFPEYYQQIQKPMDYSTMKKKLENGEYRSAQAMQKDFILILQNCRTFNAPTSDIVKEARQQHLMRPGILKEAAKKHGLFLAEDGTVLEIFDDEKVEKPPKAKKAGNDDAAADNNDGSEESTAKRIPKKKNATKKIKPQVAEKPADSDETDTEVEQEQKPKPRIRIKMKPDLIPSPTDELKTKNAGAKRIRAPDSEEGLDEAMLEPIPKKRRKEEKALKPVARKEKPKDEKLEYAKLKTEQEKKKLDQQKTKIEAGKKAKQASFFNLANWKKKRQALDGSFKSTRSFLTSLGPWELPNDMPGNKFSDVAKETLSRLKKIDRFSVFAEPVTEDDAPGYFDIVENPMDFATIKGKINNGEYGKGSDAVTEFFNDLVLIFDNCLLYNDEEGDIADEAIRIMSLIPEAYVSACQSVSKKGK